MVPLQHTAAAAVIPWAGVAGGLSAPAMKARGIYTIIKPYGCILLVSTMVLNCNCNCMQMRAHLRTLRTYCT